MARKKRANNKKYFSDFFEGKLSLPHSYWIFGIVYSLVVGLVIAIFVIGLGMPDRTVNVLAFPWLIYIAVGVWRSSDKYKGPKIWSILAKIAVVLSVIQNVAGILTGV